MNELARPVPDHDDLLALRELYLNLPPKRVRWKTDVGANFLKALGPVTDAHTTREVADALGVTASSVYQMLNRPIPGKPRRWPDTAAMAPLRNIWRSVLNAHRRGDAITTRSRSFLRMRAALTSLLDDGYALQDVAAALPVDRRTLARYLDNDTRDSKPASRTPITTSPHRRSTPSPSLRLS